MKKPRNITRRKRGTRTKQRGGGFFGDLENKLNYQWYKVKNKAQDKLNNLKEKARNLIGKKESTENEPSANTPSTNAPPANSANANQAQQGGLKRKHRTKKYRKGSMNKRTKRAKRTRSRK